MSKNAKAIYDRRSDQDRRTGIEESFPLKDEKNTLVKEDRRTLANRRKDDGLEIADADISEDEFDEVFKQFQKPEVDEAENADNANIEDLEIYDYRVLYREGVECAYITVLQTEEDSKSEPALYAFREQELNADSAGESKPTFVQNIFGNEAYDAYLEQGWSDISISENDFPWTIKSWLAMNMKQDTIKAR